MAFTVEEIGARIRSRMTPEQQKASQGFSDADIGQRAVQRNPELQSQVSQAPQPVAEPQRESFGSKVGGIVEERQSRIQDIADAELRGEQGKVESTFQAIGTTVGGFFDTIMEGIKSGTSAITPDFIEKPVKEAVTNAGAWILDTPLGEEGLQMANRGAEAYGEWKDAHPRAARNLEAAVNIGSLLPVGTAAKQTTKAVGTRVTAPLKKAVTKLETRALQQVTESSEDFVRRLVRPIQTATVKKLQVPRTTEAGKGIFKRSEILPDIAEEATEKALLRLTKVSPKNTMQGNWLEVNNTIKAQATKLVDDLKANDFIFPRQELNATLRRVGDDLKRNPALTGNASATADKLMAEIFRRVDDVKAKGSNLLKVRKDFDQWVKKQKGTKAFDPALENAFSISNREIRGAVNDFLEKKAKNVEVKQSLRDQSSLFKALDSIGPKAAIEADTAVMRAFQRMAEIAGLRSQLMQQLGTVFGVGGLGAAAMFAPALLKLGVGGLVVFKAGKFILSPQAKKGVSAMIKGIDKLIPQARNASQAKLLRADQAFLIRLLKETEQVEKEEKRDKEEDETKPL